ncbi:MAG: hypothetical protein RI564_08900 [Gracilimonas sp.]|nr:hypothetical protein [Gracilimonas sp.]
MTVKLLPLFWILILLSISFCESNSSVESGYDIIEWERSKENPVFRDSIPDINYEVASDSHVFIDEDDSLKMIYTGDFNDTSSIKLASGGSVSNWDKQTILLYEAGPSGKDVYKETPFYRKASSGKHQIYYIGYEDEETYQSEIYLSEADELEGPYTQRSEPVVPRGNIAGEDVYLITSPSVVEHNDLLYMTFIGWDASPNEVTEIWIIGATSNDDGHSWTDFQKVDVPIGAEGQITKLPNEEFVAARTGSYEDREAIFYATANHPLGPWTEQSEPILIQSGPPYEADEVIAPQIFHDPFNNKQYVYYTGADYQEGWWIMMAEKK